MRQRGQTPFLSPAPSKHDRLQVQRADRRERALDIFKYITRGITWIAGSIAGLTALCYGAGFFSLRAYFAMLGLNGVIAASSNEVLTEGARFWQFVLGRMVEDTVLIVFLFVLLLLVYVGLQQLGLGRRLRTRIAIFRETAWPDIVDRFPQAGSVAILLALALFLILHYDRGGYPDILKSLSSIRDLLFQRGAAPIDCEQFATVEASKAGKMAGQLIQQGDQCRSVLSNKLTYLVDGYFLLFPVLALALANWTVRSARYALLVARIVLGAYFAMYTINLPPAYGMLAHAPAYPWASIRGEGLAVDGYRLSQEDGNILLWVPRDRAIQWLPTGRIVSIRIEAPRNLFTKQQEPGK